MVSHASPILVPMLISITFWACPTNLADSATVAPPPSSLDLTGYEITFEDDFNAMDIVPDGGSGRWFAPIHPPVGSAQYLPPSDNGPYFVEDGYLTIRAEKKYGRWTSGFIQSVDSKGHGFAQQYGYFEIRAKFPKGPATWPAFWLATQNSYLVPDSPRGEIDIVEGYGDQPNVVHTSVHIRPFHDRNWFLSRQFKVRGMADDFHRYGALIDQTWIIYYVDDEEIYRFPTLEQYRTPFYVLVDLSMVSKETLEKAQSPSDMIVDYVRVYAKK